MLAQKRVRSFSLTQGVKRSRVNSEIGPNVCFLWLEVGRPVSEKTPVRNEVLIPVQALTFPLR